LKYRRLCSLFPHRFFGIDREKQKSPWDVKIFGPSTKGFDEAATTFDEETNSLHEAAETFGAAVRTFDEET
jgi:hypothetical protein